MKEKKIDSLNVTMLRWLLPAVFLLMAAFFFGGRVCRADSAPYRVVVEDGYLALRNAKAYDRSNEIGKLYTDDLVDVLDTSDSTYWYVYAAKLGQYGYVNCNYLTALPDSPASPDFESPWIVKVDSGYLALRTAKAFDSANEIGKLYTGDTVLIQDFSDPVYWYVYSSLLGKSGYVNCNYLVAPDDDWTVVVDSGYLALRNAKAFDQSNEIGKLYTGDTVRVQDSSDSTYWYVYAPGLGKSGYVNKDYLTVPVPDNTWAVKVDTSYLALRNAKAFDQSNEIGKLYTGDTVRVQDTSDSTYWYVYSPKYGEYGYVNKDYLVEIPSAPVSGVSWTVKVDSGYLALRSAKAYDQSNEIGKLYTGDTVQVQDSSDSTYWYVYAPGLGKYGYVNSSYLY